MTDVLLSLTCMGVWFTLMVCFALLHNARLIAEALNKSPREEDTA